MKFSIIIELRYDFDKLFIVPHCLDGRQNEDETDVDCGGSCKPCEGIHFHMLSSVYIILYYQFYVGRAYETDIFIC